MEPIKRLIQSSAVLATLVLWATGVHGATRTSLNYSVVPESLEPGGESAVGPYTISGGSIGSLGGFSTSVTSTYSVRHGFHRPASRPTLTDTYEFTSTGPIDLPDPEASGQASVYPSTITVSGFTGSVIAVRVALNGLSHTWPLDLDIFVVGPNGVAVPLMSDAGTSLDLIDVDLVFDNQAADPIPKSLPIVSGTYRPFNYDAHEALPPGATESTSSLLSLALGPTGVNGDWELYIDDDFPSFDSGSLHSWSLILETVGPMTDAPTLAEWKTQQGIGDVDSKSDDDGDSATLLEEYAFNLLPAINDYHILTPGTGTSGLPHITIDQDLGGATAPFRLRVEFIRRRRAPHLQYTVQFASGLADLDWTDAMGEEVVSLIDSSWERVVVEDTFSSATEDGRFGRVKVHHTSPQ
jgi:subtilisin-like proprotein convertase family protein